MKGATMNVIVKIREMRVIKKIAIKIKEMILTRPLSGLEGTRHGNENNKGISTSIKSGLPIIIAKAIRLRNTAYGTICSI